MNTKLAIEEKMCIHKAMIAQGIDAASPESISLMDEINTLQGKLLSEMNEPVRVKQQRKQGMSREEKALKVAALMLRGFTKKEAENLVKVARK